MYPSFHYIGSKTKLLTFLKTNIESYTNKKLSNVESFGDLFSGTGIVGYFMISEGVKKVVSNDLQYYSYVVSSVVSKSELDIEKLKRIVDDLNSIDCTNQTDKDFIYTHYTPHNTCQRMFLTVQNGIKVDRIRQHLDVLKPELTTKEFNCLLKLLLYAVTKVSNTSATYGAYLKTFKEVSKKELMLDIELVNLLIDSDAIHEAYNLHILDLDIPELTIVYCDPPYNSRRYDKNYDLLTTISKYDNPLIKGITGLRIESDSNGGCFCSKVTAKKEFENLFQKAKANFIFMSYSSEGILKKQEIMDLMSLSWTNVVCFEQEYKRFKSNKNCEQNKTVMEYLFAGTKK